MTKSELDLAIEKLSEIQTQAVNWGTGSLLVLAGPGSGKTQVLTCRIARLLKESEDKSFRILALTFTNKAADEMKERVSRLASGLEERATIGTFHSFCSQVLRQHGVHIGINPNFTIYSQDADRIEIFKDALARASEAGQNVTVDDVQHLNLIDKLKSALIPPEGAAGRIKSNPNPERIALVYGLYEAELRLLNALDFSSLIFETHRLLTTFPAIAARYRKTHPYWLLDEFQDTNNAQYALIRTMAGSDFKNIFAVADDDQIIYQWNGASFRQLQKLRTDFDTDLIQLPTNFRCPPAIVEAANRLVAYNQNRTAKKAPLIAGKTKLQLPFDQHIQIRHFESDSDESNGVAVEIKKRGEKEWGNVVVLARTRKLLDRTLVALTSEGVRAAIAQRRDDFLSPEVRWLVAFLKQLTRPIDKRNIAILTASFNRFSGAQADTEKIIAEAESSGKAYLTVWLEVVKSAADPTLLSNIERLMAVSSDPAALEQIVSNFEAKASKVTKEKAPGETDLAEDISAWREISRDISKHVGRNVGLDQFLQELQLRSKEPSAKPGTVALMTIHAAKGKEFDVVYMIGLAEDIMPSFQSRQKGDNSPEMEEERRNCFVGITRAKECLILSRAEKYGGWKKAPSRFLLEMGLEESAEA